MPELTIDNVREFYDHHNIDKGNRGWVKRKVLLDEIPKFMKGRVLEVGCGCGQIANEMVKRFPDYTAIDLSPKSIDVAKQSASAVKFEGADFVEYQPEGKFDTIAFFDSLEHFFDWRETIKKAVSLLKPRGTIIMNLPNPDFTKYCQKAEVFEHIIDNTIWLDEMLAEFKKLHLDLIYYWLYNIEFYKQYNFCVWG